MKPALIGSGAALTSLPLHLLVDHAQSVRLAALLLAAVAAIYVGFALADARVRIVAAEVVVAVLFLGAAAGSQWSPWTIPLAYAAHAGWDAAHHRVVATAMPRWYIPFCATFDLVFAAGLTAIWLR